MSNLNVTAKGIANSLINKFQGTGWENFFNSSLPAAELESVLDFLIKENTNKQKTFFPPVKKWFEDFKLQPENVKIIFIAEKYVDQNRINDHINFKEFSDKSLEELQAEGILFITLGRTTCIENYQPHIEQWRKFNLELIDFLRENSPNALYIFLGEGTYDYSSLLSDDQMRMMVKSIDNTSYGLKKFTNTIKTYAASILKKAEMSEVNW